VRSLVLLPKLMGATAAILNEERPSVVVSTGGYAAGPIVWAASRRGIPTVVQEQNAQPGVTTRWLAPRANQIHLGFPEARQRLKIRESTLVFDSGNPITPPPVPKPEKVMARRALNIDEKAPVLLVIGGSQGAGAINRAVADAIDRGALANVTVLWGTGKTQWNDLGSYHRPPKRIVRAFWDPLAEAYAAADLVVARAGAMTTAELCAWGLPTVYIPLPHAAADHQTRNAKALVEAGAAVRMVEGTMTSDGMVAEVRRLLDHRDRMAEMADAALSRARPHASEDIAKRILALAG
jgi:UDP-N-acetylglucosamine--N-acetylmuramyl-(pentapeptide) pyrophosphoryl-undecaprenol N-acetylglucosamine transferase